MRIESIEIWKEDLKLKHPYMVAYKTIDSAENIFVLLKTDTGITGIGAGCPAQEVTGESMESCESALDELDAILKGQDIRNYRSILKVLQVRLFGTPAAMAAADLALHDLVGKSLGLPLAELLGRVHKTLPTSMTIGIKPLRETLKEAKEFIEQGFSILKLKIGLDVEEDIERVLKVRETFGSEILLRVDANTGYTAEEYRTFFNKTSECVEFYEQPLQAGSIKEMQVLPESMRRLCAADESLLTPADAPPLFHPPRPFGIFNIKLMKCGGIAPGMEIAGMAVHAGIDIMWGCMEESIVSIAGALHAALASPATRYLDLDGSFYLSRDIVTAGFVFENGNLTTTDQPGLGVKRL